MFHTFHSENFQMSKNGRQDGSQQSGQEHGPVHQVQDREHHDKNQLGHEKHHAGEVNPNEVHTHPAKTHAEKEAPGITIYIDHIPYRTVSEEFSGADLRALCKPPIGADMNLFRVVSGKGDDIQVSDADKLAVNMRESTQGRHFFSDTIVPSKDAIARRAYAIYLADGSQPGHDAENWAKAEAQIDTGSKK